MDILRHGTLLKCYLKRFASEVFRAYNVRQHWHMPIIGVGEGSTKLSSVYALTSSFLTKHKRILHEGDLVLIDIAPVYMTYAGDYTTTHVFGNNPELEALVAYAQDVSRKIAEYASNEMIVADVFHYAQELIVQPLTIHFSILHWYLSGIAFPGYTLSKNFRNPGYHT